MTTPRASEHMLNTDGMGLLAPAMLDYRSRLQRSAAPIPSAALAQFKHVGFCVVPNYFPPAFVDAILTDVLLCEQEGLPRAAGLTTKNGYMDTSVRLSSQLPLIPPPRTSAGNVDTRMALTTAMRSLCIDLDHVLKLPLQLEPLSMELAYLLYPIGGRYQRHIDIPNKNDGWVRSGRSTEDGGSFLGHATRREVSMLLYLNRGWDPAWGGQLRIYHGAEGDMGAAHTDITPEGGTLVLLRSDRVPHEVLPTEQPRQCVVGWFRSERRTN